MLKDSVTAKERLQVPLAWKLRQLGAKFLNLLKKRNANMANQYENPYDIYTEDFIEDKRRSLFPFASEDEEHRYFDDLQRASDIRSAI